MFRTFTPIYKSMKRLLTFEAFVPKNLDKRSEDLKKMQAKELQELQEYENFVMEFSKNLAILKGKTSKDEVQQIFIDLFKGCDIKIDHIEYPFMLFLFKDGKYMFQYDWKNDYFWCSRANVLSMFETKFEMSYQDFAMFITSQIEIYFNSIFSKIKTCPIFWIGDIEEHFKFRSSM